ncbi:MAG: isoprenylcysteine carboxylmethyltransferase family protein [Methylovirgula sp.]
MRIKARLSQADAMPRARLFFAVMVALAVQFGLAILGWGGFVPFFSHKPFIGLLIVTIGLSIASLFTRGNLSPGEREDRNNRWVFIAFTVVALLSCFVPAYTDRIGFWTLDGDGVRWLGLCLFAAGGILRIWPVFVLGDRFSGLVAIQSGHRLVTSGIYAQIRNPSYLGLLIGALGWVLAFRSLVGILLTALYLPPLVARMHAEETLLRSHFGDAYAAYYARTWRLIPRLY